MKHLLQFLLAISGFAPLFWSPNFGDGSGRRRDETPEERKRRLHIEEVERRRNEKEAAIRRKEKEKKEKREEESRRLRELPLSDLPSDCIYTIVVGYHVKGEYGAHYYSKCITLDELKELLKS